MVNSQLKIFAPVGIEMIIVVMPKKLLTLALLTLDRYLGTNFFTADNGGNAMMYVNLIWIWGTRRSTS